MTRLTQTCTTIPGGDCLRTCVACLLGYDDPLDVPHFCGEEPYDRWFQRLGDWLETKGMGAATSELEKLAVWIPGYCILTVKTDNPRNPMPDGWFHCVVGLAESTPDGMEFHVVHDPLPFSLRNPIRKVVEVTYLVRNLDVTHPVGHI